MMGVKAPDQIPNTKISMNSNLEPNEQRGVRLIFLDNIYVGDGTPLDVQGPKAG